MYKHSQRGQILIILLLVLVVALAIVLSLVSRSVTDVRTAVNTEQANKAYFAAESGVEQALKQLKDNSAFVSSGSTISLPNQAFSNTTVNQVGGSTTPFTFPNGIAADSPVQINFLKDYNCLNNPNVVSSCRSSGSYFQDSNTINLFWGDDSYSGPNTAAEVSFIYESGGNYSVAKFAFDSQAAAHGNNFSAPGGVGGYPNCDGLNTQLGTKNFKDCTSISLNGALPANSTLYLARIRLLYNTQTQPLAIAPSGGSVTLPAQGSQITSTGTVPGGATRRLSVFRSFPALPGIFDYVLFNASSNSLSK